MAVAPIIQPADVEKLAPVLGEHKGRKVSKFADTLKAVAYAVQLGAREWRGGGLSPASRRGVALVASRTVIRRALFSGAYRCAVRSSATQCTHPIRYAPFAGD
jgi:hypothetical protein